MISKSNVVDISHLALSLEGIMSTYCPHRVSKGDVVVTALLIIVLTQRQSTQDGQVLSRPCLNDTLRSHAGIMTQICQKNYIFLLDWTRRCIPVFPRFDEHCRALKYVTSEEKLSSAITISIPFSQRLVPSLYDVESWNIIFIACALHWSALIYSLSYEWFIERGWLNYSGLVFTLLDDILLW